MASLWGKKQQPNVDPRNINQLFLEGDVEAQAVTGSSLGGRRSDQVPGRRPGFPLLPCCGGRGDKEEEEGGTPREQAVEVEIPFLWVKGQQLSVRRWRYVNGRLGSLSSQSNSSWVKTSTARNMKPLTPPPATHSHIYTHHNSCYIKAVITTASWLSISVYLWCIIHSNVVLIQRLSCHCSIFGWEKNPKQHMAVTYSTLSPGNKGQMNVQHLSGSSNLELLIAWFPLPISI